VCVSVCLSFCEDISGTTLAICIKFFVHVAYSRGSVLLRQIDKIPSGRDNFGFFFPTDNALYGIAFATHIKTAEPMEMPFL